MAKFTPGPWVIKHPDYSPWEVIANVDGPDDGIFHYDSICDCDQDSKSRLDSEETKANARLIAAAPEMYEALKACQLQLLQQNNRHEYVEDALNLACSALVKAEGGQ